MDSIKDEVRSFVWVPEFDKQLKKAGGHIGRNVVEITIKIKTIVRRPLMIDCSNSINHDEVQVLSNSKYCLPVVGFEPATTR